MQGIDHSSCVVVTLASLLIVIACVLLHDEALSLPTGFVLAGWSASLTYLEMGRFWRG